VVDGTWKLNQNESADARIGAVFGLEALVESGAAARIAVSMRDLPE
jgi:predicted FMN-binding regulatory protein PaiB